MGGIVFKISRSPAAFICPSTNFHGMQEFVMVQSVLLFKNYYLVL